MRTSGVLGGGAGSLSDGPQIEDARELTPYEPGNSYDPPRDDSPCSKSDDSIRGWGSTEGWEAQPVTRTSSRENAARPEATSEALTRGALLTAMDSPGKARLFLKGFEILRRITGASAAKSIAALVILSMILGVMVPIVSGLPESGSSSYSGEDASWSATTPASTAMDDFSLGTRSSNLTTTTSTKLVTVWTEEYSIRVDYSTSFVDYTIRPYFTTDYIRYRRVNPQYAGDGTVDHQGNALDSVSMTISKWGKVGTTVWFLESCPEFSLNHTFDIYRDYFELKVEYTPGTKKVVTTYFVGLYSSSGSLYNMLSGGKYYRYVPGQAEDTPASNALGGWYPRHGFVAPAFDLRTPLRNMGVEWGYDETAAYLLSPVWMNDMGTGGPSVFGLKYTSVNSVVPNPSLGSSETFSMFVRPYKFADGKDRGYDVGYAQWIAPRIAAAWGNHDTPIFPLTAMDIWTWSSSYKAWVEQSQIKVATYSSNPDQINWNYRSSQMAGYEPDAPSQVPYDWLMLKSDGTAMTTSDGSAICSPVSGPYTTAGTYRWHLIQNHTTPSWWHGSTGVFWDEMNLYTVYNTPKNDYKNRAETILEGYLKLIQETYQSGYWSYVISNTFTPDIHTAIASDLNAIEGYEPSSMSGYDFVKQVHSTMNFINNIPAQYRPNYVVYQNYDASDNPSDQEDVYSVLFGSARYGFYVAIPSTSSFDSQQHNLVMAEEMFKAMGCSRNSDVRIPVGTLDLAVSSTLTTGASMVVMKGAGAPIITFTTAYDRYRITNLRSSSTAFDFAIPSAYYYDAGNDVQRTAAMTFWSDGKGTFHGKVAAEKTGSVVKRNDLKVVHSVSGTATVLPLSITSTDARLTVNATGGTTTISVGGFTTGKSYVMQVDGSTVDSKTADAQGFVTFTYSFGLSDAVVISEGTTGDTTPPSIISVTPANGAANVEITQNVVLVFSESMDKTSVQSAFSMKTSGADVPGSVAWSSQDTVMTFTPSSPLSYSSRFYANVTTAAKDVAGNSLPSAFSSSFTTKSMSDTTPPYVTSVYPQSGSSGVPTLPTVIVSFSELMDTDLTSDAFHLSSSMGEVAGSVQWSDLDTTLIFTPSADLATSTQYMITVTTAAADAFGNKMSQSFTSTFTTAASVSDTTAPTLTAVIPANGAAEVEVTQNVVLTFSEPMNKTSVEGAFSLTTDSGSVRGFFSWDTDARTIVFTPFDVLEYAKTHTVAIASGAKDLSGNAIAAAQSFVFSTKDVDDTTPPYVTDSYPSDGESNLSIYSIIMVGFSEQMDSASTAQAFSLSSSYGTVPGSIQWSEKSSALVFAPSAHLVPSTEYTITVSTEAADIFGNHASQPFMSSFVTMAETSDTSAPFITHSPGQNGEVGTGYPLTATVTDASQLIRVTLVYVDVHGNYNSIAMGLAPSAFSATIPSQDMVGTVRYYIEAQDEFGNLATTSEYSLLFEDTTPPSIRIVSPFSGQTIDMITNIETVVDDNYGISSVEFFVDGVSVANDPTEPYVMQFNPKTFGNGTRVVSAMVVDLVGLNESASVEISVVIVDTTAPRVIAVHPDNGATGIGQGVLCVLQFSEPMDALSTAAAVSLADQDSEIQFETAWENDSTISIAPVNGLSWETMYWLNVSVAALDAAGNPLVQEWSSVFTTGTGPDTTQPYVLSHSPSAGATDVPLNVAVSIEFSESMNRTSVERAFSVSVESDSLEGGFAWSLDSTTVTFLPSDDLSLSKTYTVSVRNSASDIEGNLIGSSLTYQFTTVTVRPTGSIFGIVTDGARPISGAVVTTGWMTATSAEDGSFEFSDVPSGSYSLSAAIWGYAGDELIRVAVEPGQSVSGIVFMLSPAPGRSTITGTVVNANNVTVEAAMVTIVETEQRVFTDTNGRYVLTNVTPGTYSIKIAKLFFVSEEIANVEVPEGANAILVMVGLRYTFDDASTDKSDVGVLSVGDLALQIILGAGAAALIGGIAIKGPWRYEKRKPGSSESRLLRFRREAVVEELTEMPKIRDVSIERIEQLSAELSMLPDEEWAKAETSPARVKSKLKADEDEEFEQAVRNLERLN